MSTTTCVFVEKKEEKISKYFGWKKISYLEQWLGNIHFTNVCEHNLSA